MMSGGGEPEQHTVEPHAHPHVEANPWLSAGAFTCYAALGVAVITSIVAPILVHRYKKRKTMTDFQPPEE